MAGEPDDALLRAARALRRMGGRLTRYDVDAQAVEARLARWPLPLLLAVSGAAAGPDRTRLVVEGTRADRSGGRDFGLARLAIARFRAVLAATAPPDLARRR